MAHIASDSKPVNHVDPVDITDPPSGSLMPPSAGGHAHPAEFTGCVWLGIRPDKRTARRQARDVRVLI